MTIFHGFPLLTLREKNIKIKLEAPHIHTQRRIIYNIYDFIYRTFLAVSRAAKPYTQYPSSGHFRFRSVPDRFSCIQYISHVVCVCRCIYSDGEHPTSVHIIMYTRQLDSRQRAIIITRN